MGEYWGAQVHWPSLQYGLARYIEPPPSAKAPQFSMPDGDGNKVPIDAIRTQIMNQHPEEISALADQWQNAYNLLASVREQLLGQSNALVTEGWKSPTARDAFMQAGPGKTLTYLDEWQHAASNNVTILRGMVGIVTQARADMTKLWKEYNDALAAAKKIDGGEQFKTYWQLWKSWDDARKDEAINDLNHTQQVYDHKAQHLAFQVAQQIFHTAAISTGYGPPFTPMNAVMNIVGHKPWRMPGAPPGGPPSISAPPVSINPLTVDPKQLRNPQPDLPTPPPERLIEPPLGIKDPHAIAVPGLHDGQIVEPPGQVAPPPTAGVLPLPPPGLGVNPGLAPINANAPVTAPGAPPTAPSLPPGTGGMRDGVFKGRGTLGRPGFGGESPNAAIHSPGAPPPAPGHGQTRKPPAGQGQGQDEHRVPNSMSTETEEGFGRPPSTTAPPVLNNQRPGQQHRDRPGQLAPPGSRGNHLEGPTPASRSAAPPVLNSPAANPARPTPTRATPPGTGRQPDRTRERDQQRPGQAVDPGTDWTGTQEVRAGASAPILDAPTPPVTGSAVSRLEEVPKALRRTTTAASGARAVRPGAVAPELAARHTRAEGQQDERNEADPEQRMVTDEEAFTVQTPGGDVLVNQHEDAANQAGPPAAIGGR